MTVKIYVGDALEVLKSLPSESVHCIVTSPPYYGLRDYGVDGQIGLEETPAAYVSSMVAVFSEVWRVLRSDGVCWLNIGDSYAGSGKGPGGKTSQIGSVTRVQENKKTSGIVPPGLKPKDLIGIPWRLAFALQDDGWYLRNEIIWHKPNAMPESVKDRCTVAHEQIFLLTKSARYYYDADAIREPAKRASDRRAGNGRYEYDGKYSEARDQKTQRAFVTINPAGRNKRSVWTISTKSYSEAHFATFPPELPEICIKAGCPDDGVVLDPFGGAGTTGLVAEQLNRDSILIELNPEYAAMARDRINNAHGQPLFGYVAVKLSNIT
jgi:DNA modification methylase